MAVRRIALVGHTHHDIGYTNSPRLVDPLHVRLVSEVLDLAEAHPGDGPDAFRWTFEIARPVLRFLAEAAPADVDRLRRLVAEGRIAVTAGYANMTQLPGDAELDAAYDLVARIRAAGIPVRTEQHGDVNGLAWGAVTGMRRAGIERLLMALNPDHGRAPFEQPTAFRWRGPGQDEVAVLLSTHYGIGEEWGIIDADLELAEERIAAFVTRLDERDDWPFETAVVHAANDNRWPSAAFLDVVRFWNARHPEQPMRTATVDQALDDLLAEGIELPVVAGEWSDWWAHGHGSTARTVAAYREAGAFVRAAGAALALARLNGDGDVAPATVIGHRRGPVRVRSEAETVSDLDAADEQLLLFDEHTWGSWETYARPTSTFNASSWSAKEGFAHHAWDLGRDLAIEGVHRAAAADGGAAARGVLVFNPTELPRREPVETEDEQLRPVTAVVELPPFGLRVLPRPAVARAEETGSVVSNGRLRVEVDPARGGAVSIVDLATGRELLDPAAGHGLGAVVVERIPADSEHPMVHGDPKAFHPEDPGPRFDRLPGTGEAAPRIERADGLVRIRWTTSAPGVPAARAALTLYDGLDLVDLEVELDKPARLGPESIHIAFPFAVDDPTFLLQTAGAVYAAEHEQLPDTSKDWYSIQHAVGVAGADFGVLWGTFDAPLVQLGGFHTGEWAATLVATSGTVNSWVMNNLHFTNFQAQQDGSGRYRYRFQPHRGPMTKQDVAGFGRRVGEPLLALPYSGPAPGRLLAPAVPDGLQVSLRPVEDGLVRVRLRNVTGAAIPATVRVPGSEAVGTASVVVPAASVADVLLRPVVRSAPEGLDEGGDASRG